MGKWPDLHDSEADRARALLAAYREALQEADPARCEVLDKAAIELGQSWVVPQQVTTAPGTLVSTQRAAELFGVAPATVRGWGSKKSVPVWKYDDGWDLDQIRSWKASQRRRRGHR
jgi:hypothetical protein